MIILDELTYLVKYEMISENAVVEMINNRPHGLHLIITGQDAGEKMIAAADLVTEMREVKHPFSQGIKACPGIEF
jgi:cob(I)alamin adenosyltransferase